MVPLIIFLITFGAHVNTFLIHCQGENYLLYLKLQMITYVPSLLLAMYWTHIELRMGHGYLSTKFNLFLKYISCWYPFLDPHLTKYTPFKYGCPFKRVATIRLTYITWLFRWSFIVVREGMHSWSSKIIFLCHLIGWGFWKSI